MTIDQTQEPSIDGNLRTCMTELNAAMNTFSKAREDSHVYQGQMLELSGLSANIRELLNGDADHPYTREGRAGSEIVEQLLRLLEAHPIGNEYKAATDAQVVSLPMTTNEDRAGDYIRATWQIMHDLAAEALDIIKHPEKKDLDLSKIIGQEPTRDISQPKILRFDAPQRGHGAG